MPSFIAAKSSHESETKNNDDAKYAVRKSRLSHLLLPSAARPRVYTARTQQAGPIKSGIKTRRRKFKCFLSLFPLYLSLYRAKISFFPFSHFSFCAVLSCATLVKTEECNFTASLLLQLSLLLGLCFVRKREATNNPLTIGGRRRERWKRTTL